MSEQQPKTHQLLPDQYLVYTDGACSGNPGPGGWGYILVSPESENSVREVREGGGGASSTTNNRMELTAVLSALKQIPKESSIMVFTDSTYVIRGITQWAYSWRRNGWKTSEGQPVTNQDLFEELMGTVSGKKIKWNYVRGHRGHDGNERCDVIAVCYSKNEPVTLFRGPVGSYSTKVLNLPEYEPLPEMKPKGEKKAAFCYVSLVNGKLSTHSDWASCEAAVKGQSGAKFKKAMTADEVQAIKKSWGIVDK